MPLFEIVLQTVYRLKSLGALEIEFQFLGLQPID